MGSSPGFLDNWTTGHNGRPKCSQSFRSKIPRKRKTKLEVTGGWPGVCQSKSGCEYEKYKRTVRTECGWSTRQAPASATDTDTTDTESGWRPYATAAHVRVNLDYGKIEKDLSPPTEGQRRPLVIWSSATKLSTFFKLVFHHFRHCSRSLSLSLWLQFSS